MDNSVLALIIASITLCVLAIGFGFAWVFERDNRLAYQDDAEFFQWRLDAMKTALEDPAVKTMNMQSNILVKQASIYRQHNAEQAAYILDLEKLLEQRGHKAKRPAALTELMISVFNIEADQALHQVRG